MTIEIRPIAEEHIPSFWAAVDSIARENRYLAWLEAPPIESTYAYVRAGIATNRPHFVALLDGTVVGFCDIVVATQRPAYAHSGILGMGVIAAYRGNRVGHRLITETLAKARSVGLTRIELSVREDNIRAIGLYEKIGFVREGLLRNAGRLNGKYFNKLVMGLLFCEDDSYVIGDH